MLGLARPATMAWPCDVTTCNPPSAGPRTAGDLHTQKQCYEVSNELLTPSGLPTSCVISTGVLPPVCARCRVCAATGTNQSGPAPPAACGVPWLRRCAAAAQAGQYSGANTSQPPILTSMYPSSTQYLVKASTGAFPLLLHTNTFTFQNLSMTMG